MMCERWTQAGECKLSGSWLPMHSLRTRIREARSSRFEPQQATGRDDSVGRSLTKGSRRARCLWTCASIRAAINAWMTVSGARMAGTSKNGAAANLANASLISDSIALSLQIAAPKSPRPTTVAPTIGTATITRANRTILGDWHAPKIARRCFCKQIVRPIQLAAANAGSQNSAEPDTSRAPAAPIAKARAKSIRKQHVAIPAVRVSFLLRSSETLGNGVGRGFCEVISRQPRSVQVGPTAPIKMGRMNVSSCTLFRSPVVKAPTIKQ